MMLVTPSQCLSKDLTLRFADEVQELPISFDVDRNADHKY